MKGEALEQSMLFQWCELQKGKYPMLSLLFAIPNGGMATCSVNCLTKEK